MKTLSWVISSAVVALLLWLFWYIYSRGDNLQKEYYTLLRKYQSNPGDDALRGEIYELGRKYYRNKKTGIDMTIERDLSDAAQGKVVEEL